jgi:hypothetical protein
MMLNFFLILNILIAANLPVFSQSCPPYPEEPTTGILTYIRLPAASAPSTIRFLYRLTIDCDSAINYYDLAIADLRDPGIVVQDLNFQLDSASNVTGVIDPCVVLSPHPAVPPTIITQTPLYRATLSVISPPRSTVAGHMIWSMWR